MIPGTQKLASEGPLRPRLARHLPHVFPFGDYYDPAHMGFPLPCGSSTTDRVQARSGVRGCTATGNMEIVTYVLDGGATTQG